MTMNKDLLKDLQKPYLKTDMPVLGVGDTVDVHCRIIEGANLLMLYATMFARMHPGATIAVPVTAPSHLEAMLETYEQFAKRYFRTYPVVTSPIRYSNTAAG